MRRILSTLLPLTLMLLVSLPVAAGTFSGENPLGVPTDLMSRSQQGLEYVYQRNYGQAVKEFTYIAEDYPSSPVGPTGLSLIWQAKMLENYDFRYEAEYYEQHKDALRRLEVAIKDPQLKAWNLFLMGGVVGLEGVQLARKGDYLRALNKGWDAIESMKQAFRINKEFHDPELGLGIYNYWRSVFTDSVKYLPFFPDKRAEGLEQMISARDKGLLVGVAGGLTLAYTYMEARQYDKAQAEMAPLIKNYPNSIIGHQVLGRIYKAQRKWDEAAVEFKRCLEIDPGNNYAVLYLGEVYYASRKHNLVAERYYNRFLETDAPTDQKALAHYRLGQLARRFDFVDEAIEHYQLALKMNPEMKRADTRLQEMQKRKADGKGRERRERPTPTIPSK